MSRRRRASARERNNFFIAFGIFAVVFIIVVIILSLVLYRVENNHQLSASEKDLQRTIRRETRESKALVDRKIISELGWNLVRINMSDARGNYSYVILHDNKLVTGPGTNFDIDELENAKVPDSIIKYFHPEQPWYLDFDDDFDKYFEDNADQVKNTIYAFGVAKQIKMHQVKKVSKVKLSVSNPRENNRTERADFDFTVNGTKYTFEQVYYAQNFTNTYNVKDQSGKILFTIRKSIFNS